MKKITAVLMMAFSLGLFSSACGPGKTTPLSTPTFPAEGGPTQTPARNATSDGGFNLPQTPTFDPANLTPSARSGQLAEALIAMSDRLPCQDDSGSPSVKAFASEVQLTCTQTNGDLKYTLFLDVRLGGFPLGLECFHGYLASRDESSYPVQEVNAKNEVTKSYLSTGRLFRWFAQGIDYTVIQRIDGGAESDLPPADLPEKIYAEMRRMGFITSEGQDCTP